MHANFDFRRLMVAAVLWSGFSALALGQVQLQFWNSGAGSTVARVLPWEGGDKLVVGTAPAVMVLRARRGTDVATEWSIFAVWSGGSGNDVAADAAIDPAGNLWIVGSTDSDDFPLMNPIVSTKVPYRLAGFVMELDPMGQVLFSTYLCGQQPRYSYSPPVLSSGATAITIDKDGNVYVGGSTDEPDFPATPGAFLSGKGRVDSFDSFFYAFLVKISPSGKLIYSTELGTGSSNCFPPGSGCLGRLSTSGIVSGVFADDSGAATVRWTHRGCWELTTICHAGGGRWDAAIVVGGYSGRDFAVGNKFADCAVWGKCGPVRAAVDVLGGGGRVPYLYGHAGLFAAQLKGDGSGFNYIVDLGQADDSAVDGMVVDAAGRAFLAGRQKGSDWLWGLDALGAAVRPPIGLPAGTITAPPGIDGSNVLLSGTRGSLLTVAGEYHGESPAVVGFANAASFALEYGGVSGGAIDVVWV